MIRFCTLHSTYEIDTFNMTWTRTETSIRSGGLMSDSGPLFQLPDVIVGERCLIVEGPSGLHVTLLTSKVTKIMEVTQ